MPSQKRKKMKRKPMRFPRYAGDKEIAPAANRVWRNPRFKARCHKDKTELAFCLPFSIPRRLKRKAPAVFHRLFDGEYAGLASALVLAYRQTEHEGKPIKKRIDLLLRKVFVEALEILKVKHNDKYGKSDASPNEKQDGLRKALIKPGPQKDERKRRKLAIRLANRYRQVLPQVQKLHKFVHETVLAEEDIRSQIEERFTYDWVPHVIHGKALQNLLPIVGYRLSAEPLSSKVWTPRQLTVGILVCEEEFRLGPATIYEQYINLGNRLLNKKQ